MTYLEFQNDNENIKGKFKPILMRRKKANLILDCFNFRCLEIKFEFWSVS